MAVPTSAWRARRCPLLQPLARPTAVAVAARLVGVPGTGWGRVAVQLDLQVCESPGEAEAAVPREAAERRAERACQLREVSEDGVPADVGPVRPWPEE